MSELWRYHNPDIYDSLDVYTEEDKLYIYDTSDPLHRVTHWLSADEEDVVDLNNML